MTTAIVKSYPTALCTWQEAEAFARSYVSGLQVQGIEPPGVKLARAIVKAQAGRELGIGPFASQTAIHVIEGKASPSANLLAMLIKRSGTHDFRVLESDTAKCVLSFRERAGGGWEEIGQASFTVDEAKQAGLVKDKSGWVRYASDMLFSRALSRGFRRYCPHLSFGATLYTPEELGAEVDQDGVVEAAWEVKPAASEIQAVPADHLRRLIREASTEESAVLDFCGVTKIEDIPLADHAKIVGFLKLKTGGAK